MANMMGGPMNQPVLYDWQLEVTTNVNGQTCTFRSEVLTIESFEHPDSPIIGNVTTAASCDPYMVDLSITNPYPTGSYVWSSGHSGTNITVERGGAYEVTYYPDDLNCPVSAQTYVPKNPEEFIWFFPSGCIDLCPQPERQFLPVIPGMPADFDNWSYIHPTFPDSDTGMVDLYDIRPLIGGTSDLALGLENLGCIVLSEPLQITTADNCESCEVAIQGVQVVSHTSPFAFDRVTGLVINNSSDDLYITFRSGLNFATVTPAQTLFVPAGQSANFSFDLVTFQVFPGGSILVMVEGSTVTGETCQQSFEVMAQPGTSQPPGPGTSMQPNSIQLNPNPATSHTQMMAILPDYTGKAMVTIFDLNGISHGKYQIMVDNGEAALEIDVNTLPPGQYVVRLDHGTGEFLQELLIIK
jgi:hypothetical protein